MSYEVACSRTKKNSNGSFPWNVEWILSRLLKKTNPASSLKFERSTKMQTALVMWADWQIIYLRHTRRERIEDAQRSSKNPWLKYTQGNWLVTVAAWRRLSAAHRHSAGGIMIGRDAIREPINWDLLQICFKTAIQSSDWKQKETITNNNNKKNKFRWGIFAVKLVWFQIWQTF